MAIEVDKRRMKLFQCEVCKFNYIEKTMAEKYEELYYSLVEKYAK